MGIHAEDIEGLLLAALLGAIIGFDREYRGKPAGFRTMMLVSLGAAIFSLVSYKMALLDPNAKSDVTRIASNIVSGIGFLGAGIIFRNGLDVKGLTTATTVWVAAGIGMAAGIGSFKLAVIATAVTWVTLYFLHRIERFVEHTRLTERYRVSWNMDRIKELDLAVYFTGVKCTIKMDKASKSGSMITGEWTVRASRKDHDAAISLMLQDPLVVELEH